SEVRRTNCARGYSRRIIGSTSNPRAPSTSSSGSWRRRCRRSNESAPTSHCSSPTSRMATSSAFAYRLTHLWQRSSGRSSARAAACTWAIEVERLADTPVTDVALGEESCKLLEQARERSVLSTHLGFLALALYDAGRFDESDATAQTAAALGASDYAATQIL